MNRDTQAKSPHNSQLEGIIESYELAFRMQTAVPELMDISQEPETVRQRYGLDDRATSAFGTQCLMARRLAESGVRFIEINHRGWDQHNNLKTALPRNCRAIDQPIAALIDDLKQRGLLENTLIITLAEFGRTPKINGSLGRDHFASAWSASLTGCGVQGGAVYGASDEDGQTVKDGEIGAGQLFATIYNALGIDHHHEYYLGARPLPLVDLDIEPVQEVLA